MGTASMLITSGVAGTVRSHSEWLPAVVSPPLLEYITVTPSLEETSVVIPAAWSRCCATSWASNTLKASGICHHSNLCV